MKRKNNTTHHTSASSMADIAFLLLVFFMVATNINNDKGLMFLLPTKQQEPQPKIPISDKNLFKVLVNSENNVLAEGVLIDDLQELRDMVKKFVLNRGKDPELSDDPQKAIISLKAGRGTNYDAYIAVLNEVQGAYYDIYAARAGLTNEAFRKLNTRWTDERRIYEKAKKGIPMNISTAIEDL